MNISAKPVLKILHVLSWIIFVGVCIEAGGFIVNAFFALVNPKVISRLWQQADLSALSRYDNGYFFVMVLFMSIVALLRGLLFYLIIKLLYEKKLDLAQPFSRELRRFVLNVAYLSFLIGLFSVWGSAYAGWLVKLGVPMPDAAQLRLGGADVWLFMSIILFVIAQIFRRGIEMQTENELTI
ncbi:DUF2975 domain-containing protein [Taibaiella helva]|uniref:DUF2975 domain-containing protein n=1 Tax=Taibaiella helva TaxID=2301235 RepID=UPI000E595CAA|nr:DUF2975 domain-containing protein [Taibaiella helva]